MDLNVKDRKTNIPAISILANWGLVQIMWISDFRSDLRNFKIALSVERKMMMSCLGGGGRNPPPLPPLSGFSATGVGFRERLLRNRERNLPGINHSLSSKSSAVSLSSLICSSIFQQIRRLCISLRTGLKCPELILILYEQCTLNT